MSVAGVNLQIGQFESDSNKADIFSGITGAASKVKHQRDLL